MTREQELLRRLRSGAPLTKADTREARALLAKATPEVQECNHVAAYYWHLYSTRVCPAGERNGYHAVCMDYGLAAKDKQHALRWFRH